MRFSKMSSVIWRTDRVLIPFQYAFIKTDTAVNVIAVYNLPGVIHRLSKILPDIAFRVVFKFQAKVRQSARSKAAKSNNYLRHTRPSVTHAVIVMASFTWRITRLANRPRYRPMLKMLLNITPFWNWVIGQSIHIHAAGIQFNFKAINNMAS